MKYYMQLCIIVLSLVYVPVFAQQFVPSSLSQSKGLPGQAYPSMTEDGAWCWFSDPRAIYYEGQHERTYAGWVSEEGDVVVGYFDHVEGRVKTYVLHEKLEVDDHDNPALLIDGQGRLHVFFSKHGSLFPIQLYRAESPEMIDSWEPVIELKLNDMERYSGMRDGYTYQNPVYLAAEQKMFLFWRGADFKPNFSVSSDGGKTWEKGEIFILPERIYKNRRPYLKVYSDGNKRIHFAFTDGHPRNESENSIYYMYYERGAYYRADGRQIKTVADEPIMPRETSVAYDATANDRPKSWIWDIAQDKKGRPVLVYAKFPDDKTHIYCYARWDGKQWHNFDLVNSGDWFPQTQQGAVEREPNYSGGITIDKENPSILYLSVKRDGVFEIEKWQAKRKGKKWKVERVTQGSSQDNIRPLAIRNAAKGNPVQVLWLNNKRYLHYTDYSSSIKMAGKRNGGGSN